MTMRKGYAGLGQLENSHAVEFHLAGEVTKNQSVLRNVKGRGEKSATGNEKAVNQL